MFPSSVKAKQSFVGTTLGRWPPSLIRLVSLVGLAGHRTRLNIPHLPFLTFRLLLLERLLAWAATLIVITLLTEQ